MTLFEVLHNLEGDGYLPLKVRGFNDTDRKMIDCRPESTTMVEIRFMCEEETWITVSTFSPILVPWYNCTVNGIDPVNDHTIAIWLAFEPFLLDNYSQHIDMRRLEQ